MLQTGNFLSKVYFGQLIGCFWSIQYSLQLDESDASRFRSNFLTFFLSRYCFDQDCSFIVYCIFV